MIFKQFVQDSLGHASYLVGSEETGEAFVLDVRRDVDGYFSAARDEGLRIAYAADTHQHNDYLTGICELPERGPVQLLASARARLGYPVRHLEDGHRLRMGEVEFEAMHTPGHTPEHMSLLVRDLSRGEEPALLLSGGALLVGDVARPDLLGGPEAAREHAATLVETLRSRILSLPDHVEVFPTHVAGSLCGGSIGSRMSTTIGYERRMNQLLRRLDAGEDAQLDLTALPAVPPYWRRMRELNTQGPPLVGVLKEPPALPPDAFADRRDDGHLVLDCRSPEAFGSGHLPGSLNVTLDASFATWAGTVLPPETPYLLVLERPEDLWVATWELLRIGYAPPAGWLSGGLRAWRTGGRPLARLPEVMAWELREALGHADPPVVVDVRQPGEWQSGHIEGARFLTGAEIPARKGELPRDRRLAFVCGSGRRSAVAASVLLADGHDGVMNVLGGMSAWTALDYPTVTPR